MTRQRLGSVLVTIAGVGFLATAGLHGTGYAPVTGLAQEAPADLRPLVPLLWLAFSSHYVLVGVMLLIGARRPGAAVPLMLLVAALLPAADAALQVRFIGFVAPTALLVVLAGLTLAAAAASPSLPRSG